MSGPPGAARDPAEDRRPLWRRRRRWYLAGVCGCGLPLAVLSPIAANAWALTAATAALSFAMLACAALALHATERMWRRR